MNIDISKFDGFNPYTCTIEELKNKIKEYKQLSDLENDLQMAVKIFINGIYGGMGCEFYKCYNPSIAEATTIQGQDLIKFASGIIDDYIANIWHTDITAHIRIADIMKSKFPNFDVDAFLVKARKKVELPYSKNADMYTLACGGDSVVGNSIIKTTDGDFTIEELFNECTTDRTFEGKMYVKSNRKIYNIGANNEIIISKIKYIIRHKTNKESWCLRVGNNIVNATSDHSFIVFRNGKKISIKPIEISKYDKVILFVDGKSELLTVEDIYTNGCFNNEYVYDIEVETNNDDEHNFFANNILVHNTDSVSADSIIRTEKHKNGITIEDFYNENINNIDDVIMNGHESVLTNDKVLNWSNKNKLYYGNVKRIIKHKVSKPKWKLKTTDGAEVICTNDHSLVIFRDGKEIHIKPSEVKKGDKVVSIKK